jgi:hypothetical protein
MEDGIVKVLAITIVVVAVVKMQFSTCDGG